MRLRGFAKTTHEQHTLRLRALAAYSRRSPAGLGEGELRRFLEHDNDERKISVSSHVGSRGARGTGTSSVASPSSLGTQTRT